jgi:hypothetical protein
VKNKNQINAKLLAALHAFGYPSVKLEEVEAATECYLKGEDTGADIVKMLVADWLKGAGVKQEKP